MGRLDHYTMARVFLANPYLNGRQLRDVLSLDHEVEDGRKVVSHGYVGTLRNALVETIKGLNKDLVASLVAAAPAASCVFVMHFHEEASMRYRSYVPLAVENPGDLVIESGPRRGRYSKVQNNSMFVQAPCVFTKRILSIQRRFAAILI